MGRRTEERAPEPQDHPFNKIKWKQSANAEKLTPPRTGWFNSKLGNDRQHSGPSQVQGIGDTLKVSLRRHKRGLLVGSMLSAAGIAGLVMTTRDSGPEAGACIPSAVMLDDATRLDMCVPAGGVVKSKTGEIGAGVELRIPGSVTDPTLGELITDVPADIAQVHLSESAFILIPNLDSANDPRATCASELNRMVDHIKDDANTSLYDTSETNNSVKVRYEEIAATTNIFMFSYLENEPENERVRPITC